MKWVLVGLTLFSMVLLVGCSGNGKAGADFVVFEITREPTVVTLRVEAPAGAKEAALRDWAAKNASIYRERYNKPIAINFYRGGTGPEYYVAIYQDNKFMMLK